ncbi:DUF1194 domain-containing protein [Aureimonas sp. SA4125]|uniref:DUF1194 domain-containing protein n=1 Tax=Aureimonas sp. SA4125 TaxID=2826993 RepID=UPI0031F67AE1
MDVELVLAVDVSWSMDSGEQRLQRDGYVAAFRSPEVQQAILDGGNQRVAVTYVEWAGNFSQSVVVPWTLIGSKADADGFAYRLAEEEPARERRTSIASAIDFSAGLFDGNGFSGLRKVIDVSGDGPNNQGRAVNHARDDAVKRGITINGLPLMTSGESSGYLSWGSIPNLDTYYADCVIGGPGAFVIPVNDWAQFPDAVRRKLVMELASVWPAPPAQRVEAMPVAGRAAADCLIGERQWQQRQGLWIDDDK